MAKAKEKYVKLGEAAAEGSFYDPTLGLKLIPGKIEKLPLNYRTSKRTLAAINGGHLEIVDSEEVQAYLADEDDDEDDEDEVTEKMLKKYNMEQLKEYILDNDTSATEEDFEGKKKPELLEEALEIFNQ